MNILNPSPLYFFVGDRWLITIHSNNVDLVTKVKTILADRKTILESSIDALYYSIISYIVEDYEQLLTAIELKVFDIEKDAQYRPSKKGAHIFGYSIKAGYYPSTTLLGC